MSQIDDILNGAPEFNPNAAIAKPKTGKSEIETILKDAPAQARGFKGWAQDIGATAVKGAIGVPEMAVGLADLATGGAAGKFLENEGGAVGFRPKQAKEIANSWHSDATLAAQRKLQEAEGIGGKFQAAIENPSNIVTAIGESLPSMGAGGVAARGLLATTRLGAMGAKGAALAGAAGEGITMAGSQAEQIRQETDDGYLTPTQSGLAAATGVAGGVFGAMGGKLANKLGIGDADTMIAQGARGFGSHAAAQSGKSIPKQVIQGAISEGLLEELPQSVAEQILQNLALGKDWSDGVDSAIVLGTLSGGAMGAGAAGLHGMSSRGEGKKDAAPGAPGEQVPAPQLSNTPDSQQEALPAAPELGKSLTGTDPSALMGQGQGLSGSTADPLANMMAGQRADESTSVSNIQRATQNRPPMTATNAGNILVSAKEQGLDLTVAPHPDGGFAIVPRAWVTPQIAAQTEAQLRQTLARVAQAEDSPVQRAARTSTNAADISLNTDSVEGYIADMRKVNTPAAKAFVGEVDAGRITRQDVEQRMAIERGKTPDQRLAEAAAQAPAQADPYAIKPSQQMGLNPNAGPLSAGAVIAVDTGAHTRVRQDAAMQQAAELAAKAPKAKESATQGTQANGTQAPQAQQTSPQGQKESSDKPGAKNSLVEANRSTDSSGTSIDYRFGSDGFAMVRVDSDGKAYIANIQIGEADSVSRGKGEGTNAYRMMAEALAREGVTLESTRWSKHMSAISPAALRVWEKLEAAGLARRTGTEVGKVTDRFASTSEVREIPTYEFTGGKQGSESSNASIQTPSTENLVSTHPETSDFGKGTELNRSSYKEEGGIGYSQYTNPESGEVDVYLAGFGDNDFVAYMRVYENGKPTNKFTSKLERQSDLQGATKSMLKSLASDLPAGHTYLENDTISTDGIRHFQNQLRNGYEVTRNNDGSTKTEVAHLSGASRVNDIGIGQTGDFTNLKVSTDAEFNQVVDSVLPLLETFGLGRSAIRRVGNEIEVDMPVLRHVGKSKQTSPQGPQAPTATNEGLSNGQATTAQTPRAAAQDEGRSAVRGENAPSGGASADAGSNLAGANGDQASSQLTFKKAVGEPAKGAKAPRGILAKKAAADAARAAKSPTTGVAPNAQEAATTTNTSAVAAPEAGRNADSGSAQPGSVEELKQDSYEAAKARADAANSRARKAGEVMNSFPRGPMGLTTDEAKKTPEWIAANAEMKAAMSDMQSANSVISKRFAKESRADRDAQRAEKLATQKKDDGSVQDQPSAAAGAKTQAAPDQARTDGAGNAATASGVPAASGAGDVQADGVKPRGVLAKLGDKKRTDAIDRIAKGTAYFGTQEKADAFVSKSGIGDTHEVFKAKAGRFEVRAKVEASPAAETPSSKVWEQSNPENRRKLLRQAGYTDGDQARAFSGSEWDDLSDTVRNAIEKQKPSNFESTSPAVQEFIDGKRTEPPTVDEVMAETKPKPSASANTIFTEDAAAAARARLKAKLGRLNSGLDPETMMDGITLAGYHIEKGARTFKAFASAMIGDLGNGVRPYLKSWYMGVKYDPRAAAFDGMDGAASVEAADVDTIESNAPESSSKTLTQTLSDAIESGNMPKDNPALKKLVESFDGQPADQARMKQAQEELETAIAMAARTVVAKNEGDRSTFNALLRMYESQPNLNIRTSTSIANQAYSTPAPLAFLASRLAGITQSTVAHEPTGGTGMLLIGADPKKAIVNELNDLRITALKSQGFNPTQKDAATQLLVPAGTQPDAVVTNPPFGSIKDADGKTVKVKVDGFNIGQIDHLIAARALDTMKDDGRATLILGANKVAGGLSTDDRIFFNWLYSHYNVAGHFEVEGDLYTRQGAGWPVRVITINGRQKSNKISPVAGTIQRVDNWSQVYEQFAQSLASATAPRSTTTKQDADKAGGKPPAVVSAPPTTGISGRNSGPRGAGNVAGTSAGVVSDRANPASNAVGAVPDEQRLNAQSHVAQPQPGQGNAPAARPSQPAGNAAVADAEAAKGNEFQSPYTPRSSRKDEGVLIPANMAQPTQDALNRLEDAVGDIDEFARVELGYDTVADLHNALMGLQVDSVATSIHQIKQGKAVVIADQTGIGKGRQAASIIRWAARQGMTPVFVSVKPSLFTDMYGDLSDIGTNDINPFIMNGGEWIAGDGGEKLFANKPSGHKKVIEQIADTAQLPEGSNAVFMTYSQINVANAQRQALMSLAQNAVFILDESHNAAGASATGDFMIGALDAAKGVVYLSATYAKRPDNMPLYFKTDIGEAAADTDGLALAMASGGLPLQTVVSNNLVKAGQMFRRERSYDGVSIESVFDTPNKDLHERMSNEATKALRAIVAADRMFHEVYVKNLEKELAESGATVQDSAGNQLEAGVQHTEFSSVVHNFVKQMLLGLKAQPAAEKAIESLKRGEKPIIAVENTMGSFLNEYAAANGIGQGDSLGMFDYRTVLTRALARSRLVVEVSPTGDKVKRPVRMDELDAMTQAAYEDAQAVIDGLTLNIPVSPIDWMRAEIQRAGFTVAEITGRNLSVDYSNPDKPVLSALDQAEQKDKVNTTRQFNSGKLDALILNVAGSTGISLHASEKFEDQRQRHMIVAQAAGDINIFMQMLGRVHRTGQVRLPKYSILSVDLPTEKRPTAVLSIKMKSLNANTSSNTESATSVKSSDILNKYGDQIVNQYLRDNYALARALDLEQSIGDDPTDDIARKATGRLALQPIATQYAFYDEVEAQYTALIDYLNKTNQNDLEPRTFDFDAKETRQEVLFEGQDKSTPFGEDAIYGEYSIKAQGIPMKPDEIRAAMAENLGELTPASHAQKMLDDLDSKFNAYYATLDDAGKDSASSVRNIGRSFLADHKIGSMFRVEINSEPFNAVVLNVRNAHKETGNPYSMSKIQVSVAVNGALRSLSVPATQFNKIETSTVAPFFKIDQLFKEQPPNQRETAKIITGNLLAAYGEIKGVRGTIISFTKQDGTSEQGILLPKLFDYGKNTQGDYRLQDGAAALKFLQLSDNKDIGRFGIMSRDGNVRVLPSGQGIRVQVPKSKLKGAKYFLDKGLIEAGGDFVSSGSFMASTVYDQAGAVKMLDLLMKKQALYALPSMAEEAKNLVGGKQDADQLSIADTPMQASEYTAASTDHQKAVSGFADRLTANRDRSVNMTAVRPGTGKRAKEASSTAALAKSMFGREVVFVKFDGAPLFNGAVSKAYPGKVFINIESARPMMAVLGHELLHELRKSNPAAYNQLAQRLNGMIRNGNIYETRLARKYREQGIKVLPADIMEELHGDIVGDNFMDPAFWAAMRQETPSLFRQVAQAVQKWLDKVANMLRRSKTTNDGAAMLSVATQGEAARPFGTGLFIADVAAARAAVAEAMSDFKGDGKPVGRGDALSVSGVDAQFSIADLKTSALDQIKQFDVKTAPKNTWAHYRGMAMQALGRRQIVELYNDELPQLETYNSLVQEMDAQKNESGAEADGLAKAWGALDKKSGRPGEETRLADLMHDATLAQMDPDKPQEPGTLDIQYKNLKSKFNALSPEAQALYRQARDMYMDHYSKVQQAIKDRIQRSEMSSGQKRQIMAKMDEDFFKKLKGVYFPLARFGKYVIVVKDANGEVKNVTRAETIDEATEARKELLKAFPPHMGNVVGKVLKQAEFNAGRDAVGKGFMADLMGVLDANGLDDELRDTVAQLYLSSLPDLSWAKHGMHRKGTPGFSQDARRAFAQNMFHGAQYLAKLNYADQLQDQLIEMQDHVKAYEGVDEYDSIEAQQVVDEMVKRHEAMMSPDSSPVSTALTSFGFLFHMGLSPASAMVNLTQTALLAYPQMAAKWGYGKTSKALIDASAETVKSGNDLGKVLKGDELAAYERAVKDGTIDVTMAHDLAGISQGEDQRVTWKIRPAMRAASYMFHHAEKFNRQATFIAAYRLAKSANPKMNEDQLYETAKKATYDGHFDYASSNRARVLQGNWQKVIFLFKQYGQNMVYTLARNAYLSVKGMDPAERKLARKTLGGILAMHASAAGVLGLPLVGPLLTLASFAGSDDDEPWDAEIAMQNLMADMLGKQAAEVMAHGLSRLTPFDISGRVALDKLILPDVQEGLEGKAWADSAMSAALGPVAGIAVNMARGMQKITDGKYQLGLEDMMPTALRGPMKAMRYAMDGAVDKSGVVITDEVNPAGVVGQALGLSPSQVRRDTERRSAIYEVDRALMDRRSVLTRMFAEASMAGDSEMVKDIREQIQSFNEKNPSRRITVPGLMQSIRNRQKRIDESKEGIYLPTKRQDAFDMVRF